MTFNQIAEECPWRGRKKGSHKCSIYYEDECAKDSCGIFHWAKYIMTEVENNYKGKCKGNTKGKGPKTSGPKP